MTGSSLLSPHVALVLSATFLIVNFTQLAARSQQLNTTKTRSVQPTLEKQPENRKSNTARTHFVQPNLEKYPENRGAPRDRKGAGTRGDCPPVKKSLTALVPLVQTTVNQKQGTASTPSTQYVLGLTTAEHPTFWFYVPYLPKNINSVKFVLLDEKDNLVTQEPIPITLSNTPGVISVSLPKTEQPLLIGQYYHWYFLIDCNSPSRSDDIAVEGLVQRIAPKDELVRRLQTATPGQRAAFYAQAGIWQDSLTTLGELRRAKPQDATLTADWQELLESVGLEDIATETIAPCCTP